MQATNRRTFVLQTLATSSALGLCAQAQAQAVLAENDPQAVALGYKADASKVDKAKQPKFAAGQLCNNCNFYQGKVSDETAACPLFGGKKVAGKGWCSAWVKKG
jgi:hypothetical protein